MRRSRQTSRRSRVSRIALIVVGVVALGAVAPSLVLAHALDATFESRLPLVAYLAGAAGAVALSFVFVLVRSRPTRTDPETDTDAATVTVPTWLRIALRAVGLVAFLWIVVQGVIGGSSDAAVAPLFLWVYGWVGVALLSAFVGPVWTWLDPFATLYDLGARLLGRRDPEPADEPAHEPAEPPFGRWPAVAGLAVFIWLELALSGGGSALFPVVAGYALVTIAGMALYGRDAWRAGETFTVWFGLLGRVAPLALTDVRGEAPLRRRGFAVGVLEPGWSAADLALVGLGVGSILFDGLSQTQIFFDIFGAPAPLAMTAILAGFLAIVVALALVAARWVGLASAGAGLLPIAVGYLAAHYLTFLLIDGQRILVAISDPFQRGWDLFGTAFFEPTADWLPPGLVWTFQLLAVVGGHMIGAWAGHAATDDEEAIVPAPEAAPGPRDGRLRQVPLAVVMVLLTTVTLWSLGQAVVKPPADETATVASAADVAAR